MAFVRGRGFTSAAALLGYTTISFLYFGVRVLWHPGRLIVGIGGDPQIFVWSMAWWPHAILQGDNPLVTHAIWAPDGLNLAWTTSVPAVAVAVAPVTLLFGPVVGYNVAAVLLPALAAWTAFLLFRHVTRAFWPAAVGGYLFGFSSYMLGQELGHMHMTSVFLVPLVALVVLRFIEGELTGAGFAWRLGVLLGAQLYLSTELVFTVSLSLALGLVCLYAVSTEARPRLRTLPRPLLGAYAVAAAIGFPLVLYALLGFKTETVNPPKSYSADLANFVVPTRLIALGGGAATSLVAHFPGNDAERGAYIGIPSLLILGWFVWSARRRSSGRFLAAAALVSAAMALGTSLWVAGRRLGPLPWDLISRLPVFNNVLPVRLTLFTSLAAATAVVLWSADRTRARWLRVVLPAAAVLALVPTLRQPDWRSHPDRPKFFAHRNLVKACLPRNENVLVYPYSFHDSSMLWQAENNFYFRMAEGYLRPDTPESFAHYPAVYKGNRGEIPTIGDIMQLARAKHVDRILSVNGNPYPSGDDLGKAHLTIQLYGGVLIAPGCGHPSLNTRR